MDELDHNPWCACAQCQPRSREKSALCVDGLPMSSDVDSHANGTGNASTNTNVLDIDFLVSYCKRHISALTREVRKIYKNENHMSPSATAMKEAKGGGAPTLHGSDVPKKYFGGFKIKIVEVRQAPDNFSSPAIIDFKELTWLQTDSGTPITAWPINKTNLQALINKYGDDTDKWIGKEPELFGIYVRNPKSGKNTPSLGVK